MKKLLIALCLILCLGVVQYSIAQISYQTIQLRRDTAAHWVSANPILAQGEPGWDTTNSKLKIGDGTTHWLDLAYTTLTPTEISSILTFSDSVLRTGDDITLVNDSSSPGNSKFYGTNSSGTKGWESQLTFQNSVVQSGVTVTLVNDSASPGANQVYGTNASGTKGYQASMPTGVILPYSVRSAPSGFLVCNGAAVSRTTYSNLFSTIVPDIGATTISIANPAVVTYTAHGLAIGDAIYFTTTGTLPSALSINTLYYIISAGFTVDHFEIATARAGGAISTLGESQNGVHTMYFCPYGLGNGTTTFNVPNMVQKFPLGLAASGTGANLGITGGAIDHTHTVALPDSISGTELDFTSYHAPADGTYTSGTNNPPFQTVVYIIKF